MINKVAIHHYTLLEKETKIIQRNLAKLEKLLSSYSPDLVSFSLTIKFHEKKHWFAGQVILSLPQKNIIGKIGDTSIEAGLREAFSHIYQELKKLKGKQFSSNSTYPDKKTIRKNGQEY